MLDRKAEETPAEEKAAHFWSPDPEVTVPALEAGGSGPLKRVWLHDFLALLCAEYKRLEEVLTEQLSVLYRKADSNGDGFLGRYYGGSGRCSYAEGAGRLMTPHCRCHCHTIINIFSC